MKELNRYPMYSVTEDGRVFSHKRNIFLSPALTKKGYLRVILRREGKTHFEYVHRLVAEAYVSGDTSLNVDHIDRNTLNNHFSNLRWVTQSDNMKNTTRAVLVEYNGVLTPLIDVCRMYSNDDNFYRRVWRRLKSGKTLEESLI